ncbi:MAG: DUF4203 domain-containing protein [Candidatus Limnocylindrales bacterium]
MDITLQGVLIGVFAVAIGLALVFRGFKLFMLLLPFIGFAGGFLLGAGLIEALFGDGFLVTVLGWGTGLVFGLVMAVLSYLYYWLAVGVLGGFIGYQVTLGLLAWIGFSETGFIPILIAFVVALGVGVAFLLLRMPTVVAIVGTAIVGAGLVVAGAALALGLAPEEGLVDGIFGLYSSEDLGWLGILLLSGLALAGMVLQARDLTPDDGVISPDQFRNPGIGSGGGPTAA